MHQLPAEGAVATEEAAAIPCSAIAAVAGGGGGGGGGCAVKHIGAKWAVETDAAISEILKCQIALILTV